jgi:hypothetical protein
VICPPCAAAARSISGSLDLARSVRVSPERDRASSLCFESAKGNDEGSVEPWDW